LKNLARNETEDDETARSVQEEAGFGESIGIQAAVSQQFKGDHPD
jgi:hypothetical protein